MLLYMRGEMIDRVAPISAVSVSLIPSISPSSYIPSLFWSLHCILGSACISSFPKLTFKPFACISVLYIEGPPSGLGSCMVDECIAV